MEVCSGGGLDSSNTPESRFSYDLYDDHSFDTINDQPQCYLMILSYSFCKFQCTYLLNVWQIRLLDICIWLNEAYPSQKIKG